MKEINYEDLLTRYIRWVEAELSNEGLTYMNILNEGPFTAHEVERLHEMPN